MVYLCSPYSSVDPDVREARWKSACWAAAMLMSRGFVVFSPIAHSHPIAKFGEMPTTWEFWAAQDLAMLHHASRLVVLALDGWDGSAGVAAETKMAHQLGIPVYRVTEAELEAGTEVVGLPHAEVADGR